MSLSFPNIDPVAFSVGPLQLRWYALAYLVGIILGWIYAVWIVRQDEAKGLRPNRADIEDFIPFAVLGVILGGRIGYTLFYQFDYYMANPVEILQIWNGGMSFHGGLLGVVAAALIFARLRGFDVWRLADVGCAAATIGLFLGRISNFINGELYGRATDVPWGIIFPAGGPEPRHPSQLYEAALEGALLFIILAWMITRPAIRARSGIVAGTFFLGYGLARLFVEFFREPDWYLGFIAGPFTMGQILCLPMILFGAGAIFYALKRRRPGVSS